VVDDNATLSAGDVSRQLSKIAEGPKGSRSKVKVQGLEKKMLPLRLKLEVKFGKVCTPQCWLPKSKTELERVIDREPAENLRSVKSDVKVVGATSSEGFLVRHGGDVDDRSSCVIRVR